MYSKSGIKQFFYTLFPQFWFPDQKSFLHVLTKRIFIIACIFFFLNVICFLSRKLLFPTHSHLFPIRIYTISSPQYGVWEGSRFTFSYSSVNTNSIKTCLGWKQKPYFCIARNLLNKVIPSTNEVLPFPKVRTAVLFLLWWSPLRGAQSFPGWTECLHWSMSKPCL